MGDVVRKMSVTIPPQMNPFKPGDKIRVKKECIARFPGICDGKVFEVEKIYTEKIYRETVKLFGFNEFHYSWFELAEGNNATIAKKSRY